MRREERYDRQLLMTSDMCEMRTLKERSGCELHKKDMRWRDRERGLEGG